MFLLMCIFFIIATIKLYQILKHLQYFNYF
nr:MAG TPA: hypothetical protein [Caudoviricetes sp.]